MIRLAQAGTATEGETDTSILLEIKNSLKSDIEKELEEVNSKKLEIKQNLIAKFLE
ncbi:MAG: hypothetical protein F6K18_31180 [Okeania sp. SIO2C2]|uniref:hypothetical protein n=1 Tax=Okeania sp. SIO2C2 TaxID=2607787 RepID=UPI0013BCFF3E|nr:hypothetical protein [Okeania sp. SIO2C2]NEP90917.1 hypothetical protein [Okeania sp. SIO2C2]